MTNLNVTGITTFIPLSNNTMSRRIDEMAYDVEIKLSDILNISNFLIQLDESTVTSVRYVNINEKIAEELLFAKSLNTDTKGLTMFKVVHNFFIEKSFPMTNCIACATDGAPAMIGRQRGFIAHLKNAVPGILTVHCVINRQYLVSKNLTFPSTYLVEKGFSAVQQFLTKSRNELEICERGDLRLMLTSIEPYIISLAGNHLPQGIPAELLNYTFDERLVVSGIVYLGLPSLILKLDFCLNAPITENKLKYFDKRIKSPEKNSELFHSCEKICDGNKQINSYKSNEKVQRKINKLKEQKQKQKNIIRNVELYRPTHPLDALFVKIPLDDTSTGDKKLNESVKSKGMDKINNYNKPEKSVKLDLIQSSSIPKIIVTNGKSDDDGDVTNSKTAVKAEDNTNVSETSFNKREKQRASNRFDDFTRFLSFTSYLTDFSSIDLSDLHYLNDPQRNSFKSSVSFKYEYDAVEEESDVEEAIEDEDFSFLIDYDQVKIEDCENFITNLNSREFEDLFESRLDIDVHNDQSMDKLNINEKSSQMIEKSSMAKIMDNQSKTEGKIIRMFNREINAFPNYRLHTLCVKKKKRTSAISQVNENGKSNICDTLSVDDNIPERLSKAEELDIKHEETDEIQIKPHIYDEILATVRKLPSQNQLILFLKFLAILGDPIASLPEVTELEVISHWFKTHLNPNKLPLTPEIKCRFGQNTFNTELLNTLDKSCKGFQRPETPGDMPISSNPCDEEKHDDSVLCGHRI
ncbi:Hypothetical protein CINCED_3A016764 [Cinara cedri]|uniref:Uncharacterized protein n=1 Tax=Cinara cedri TaxID=506608 RepID=A0A5E4N6Z9_9HEMI|nr:Hypothetical protein CINCED_3A016764 [Cinara cedri]